MKLIYPFLIVIWAFAPLPLAAQSAGPDDKPDLFEMTGILPEVLVTAENAGESLTVPSLEAARETLARTPGGVAIVDAEEYKRARATNLKDALDFAPGVFIQPRFGAEESRISIRGSGIQRTFHGRGIKLLQDGSPLNLADGGFDMQAVEPLAARYIEVFRGGNALQYGSTALGGAINFVTMTGHEASPFQARFELGSFESYRAQISSGEVRDGSDYYASLSHFSTDGFRDHSEQSNQRLFANFGHEVNENVETRFYVTYVRTDSELPGNLTKAQMEADPTQAQRQTLPFLEFLDVVDSDWKRDFDLFRIANRTTVVDGDRRFTASSFWSYKDLDHPILFVIDQESNDFGLDLRYDESSELFGHENRFTIGQGIVYGVVQDNRYQNVFGHRGRQFFDGELDSWNVDTYVENSFSITPEVALVTGTQVSYASRELEEQNFFGGAGMFLPNLVDNSDLQSWWEFSPKAGLLWDMTAETQAFVNVSRSFEPPTFGELVNPPVAGATGLLQLDAQTATTLEIGTRGAAGRCAWDLAYYYSWVEDELLEFQVLPGISQTVNADSTIHQGIEAALDVDLMRGILMPWDDGGSEDIDEIAAERPAGDRLLLRQRLLWNDFRFDNDRVFGDHSLPGIPEYYYRAEILYEHPSGFYAGPNVEWVPQQYHVDSAENLSADPYTLLGFKAGFRRKNGFSIFVEGRNLTDETYAATTGVTGTATAASALFLPGDGRSFFAGVGWEF